MVWGYKNERVKSFRALRKPHASLILQHDGFYFYFFSFNKYFLFFNAESIIPLTFMYNNILPREFLAWWHRQMFFLERIYFQLLSSPHVIKMVEKCLRTNVNYFSTNKGQYKYLIEIGLS